MSMTRRVAIVTGAAQGIGRAIAQRLAKDGFDLGLFDLPRSQTLLEDVAAGILKEHNIRVVTVCGDVSLEEDVRRLVDTVVHELGGLYAMIANAGIGHFDALPETTTESFDKVIGVNLKGAFFCYKHAAIRMIEQGTGGRIVGASSVAGKKGVADASIYSATKFAVRGLTQSAAMDYGKYGITVNAYAPGAINTPMAAEADKLLIARRGQPMVVPLKEFIGALGRSGEPEEVANLVAFFVSDGAAFITGQTYIADGGSCFD